MKQEEENENKSDRPVKSRKKIERKIQLVCI